MTPEQDNAPSYTTEEPEELVAPQTALEKILEQESGALAWKAIPEGDTPRHIGATKKNASNGKHGENTGQDGTEQNGNGQSAGHPSPSQLRYLQALAACPAPAVACRVAGIVNGALTDWREREWFRAAELAATRDAGDLLIASAWQAATEGRLEPIYQLGRLVGYKRVHSERLHEVLLRGLLPETFGEKPAQSTHQTIVLASPAAIRDAVARLSPTMAGQPATVEARPVLPE